MANAPRDNNFTPVKLATSDTDGISLIPLQADPTTHRLKILVGSGGSNKSPNSIASRDQNHVAAILAASKTDGATPVQIYIDSNSKKLLVTAS